MGVSPIESDVTMTNHERHLRTQFIACMARNYGPAGDRFARLLLRLESSIRRYTIAEFNGEWFADSRYARPFSVQDAEKLARFQARALKYASDLSNSTGKACTVTFCTDVRGYHVKVHVPDQSYNSFGGAECGMGVP